MRHIQSCQFVAFAQCCFALRTCIIAALSVDIVSVQVWRLLPKHHVAAVVIKVGLHCQRHSQLFSKEGLGWRLAQVDTHANTAAFCQVPAQIHSTHAVFVHAVYVQAKYVHAMFVTCHTVNACCQCK